jgi:elongation factor Ts
METTQVSFTAKDVMALRQKTGLGMMDCKKALTETNGDVAAAEELLRQKLKGKMADRTERVTAEGLIAVEIKGSKAAIVELRAESDFTARNEEFKSMVGDVVKMALSHPAGPIEPDKAITERIDDVKIKTGENMNFARGEKLEGGSFGSYVHFDGKRAALIQYEGNLDDATATGVCQHIVAHVPTPIGIDADDIPAEATDKIRQEALAEAKEQNKPPEIAEKIAEGKVRKYLQEKTLLNQVYVKCTEGKSPVKKILGDGVKLKRFVRYTVGAD